MREPFIGIKWGIEEAMEKKNIDPVVHGYLKIIEMQYDQEKGSLMIRYLKYPQGSPTQQTSVIWLEKPGYEKLANLDIAFSEASHARAEGVVASKSFAGIDWSAAKDSHKKGILGTEMECSTLMKLGIINRGRTSRRFLMYSM